MSRILSGTIALLLAFAFANHAWSASLKDELASINAQWDAAINNAQFDALLPLYTDDARLMAPSSPPVTGPTEIRNFFAGRGRSVSDHKVTLVDVTPMGNYAYVTGDFTAKLTTNGKTIPISGSTVRLFERQPNGQWKIKSHIFVRRE